MAYMNQQKKKELAPQIKAVLKKYGMKGTIGVRNYSTLVVTISSGALDVIGNHVEMMKKNMWKTPEHCRQTDEQMAKIDYVDVNHFWIHESYSRDVKNFLMELKAAMNGAGASIENFDNSDPMTDYFHVGWYIDINVGKWDKPYVYTGAELPMAA